MQQDVCTKGKASGELTSYQQSVEVKREAYTAEIHNSIVAEWPAAEDIGPRTNGAYPTHVLERLPKTTDELVAELERRIEQQASDVAKDRQRYNDMLTRGQAAFSDYDIGIAYGTAADAVRGGLMLKSAHISYGVSGLLKLRVALAEAVEQLERERPQLDLF